MTFVFEVETSDSFKIFVVVSTVFVVLSFSPLEMAAEKEAEEDFKVLDKD